MITDEMREEAFEFFCDDCELDLYEKLSKQRERERKKLSKRFKKQRRMALKKNANRGKKREAICILGYMARKGSKKSELKTIRRRRDRRKLNAKIAELESA